MAFKLIKDFTYPLGETYRGEAAVATFNFATIAGIAAMPIADAMINEFETQCLGEGLDTLRLKVWCDSAPLLETKFSAQFTCAPTGAHSPFPPALLAAIPLIIKAVVIIVVAVFFYLSIREVKEIMYSPAGPEVARAMKWVAIGLAVTAGGLVLREIIKAIPVRAKSSAV